MRTTIFYDGSLALDCNDNVFAITGGIRLLPYLGKSVTYGLLKVLNQDTSCESISSFCVWCQTSQQDV